MDKGWGQTPFSSENGAPAREPEVWDQRIPDFNPLFGNSPEAAPLAVSPSFDVEEYLRGEATKDLLRFSTAGSVDDGKSTLIGRLLYDTQSVYDDQVRSIEGRGTTAPGVLDLALLTDGLRAEREQGITIDVAYRYFSTARRKFIIADTPGHEQYTRNMATGASTASTAIVLVDARKGVLVQSRRHACIATLLGVRHILVAINKMDLVAYDEAIFRAIEADFRAFFEQMQSGPDAIPAPHLHFVPVSALTGENVVHKATRLPWYDGPSLLALLESVDPAESGRDAPFRLAVQRVLRPNLDFRGFAGQIAAGTIRPGDEVLALPSRHRSRVQSIVTFSGDLPVARAPQSITLTLEDELDISRGDLLVSASAPPALTTRFTASLVWMDQHPLDLTRRYLLKHLSRTVPAQVSAIRYRLDVDTLAQEPASTLALNAIGVVELQSTQPLALDPYATNRTTGSFVLIDSASNATVAAGMIRSAGIEAGIEAGIKAHLKADMEADIEAGRTGNRPAAGNHPVTPEERARRWGHAGALLLLACPKPLSDAVERTLLLRGACVLRLPRNPPAEWAAAMVAAGALVLVAEASEAGTFTLGELVLPIATSSEVIDALTRHAILNGDAA